MNSRFIAAGLDETDRFEAVSRLSPWSPFNTPHYAAAIAATGQVPWAFVTEKNHEVTDGCVGVLNTASWRRRLEIPAVPELDDAESFWHGVADFCRRQGVAELLVNSFGSTAAPLPDYQRRLAVRDRNEYVVDLGQDLRALLSKSHKKNLKKAEKFGLRIERRGDAAAACAHLDLMNSSARRRTARGEKVVIPEDNALHAALLDAGSGEVFRALRDDEVVSSILIVQGPRAAYYHSAGTSPDGMKSGASQFLILEVALQLQQDGLERFNLGGAETAGLRDFKLGFGAGEVELRAASYAMVHPARRLVMRLSHLARRLPAKLIQAFG